MEVPELACVVLSLRPQARCRVNGHAMRTMHGSFMANLARVDPALAERLHAPGAGVQPFTVSLLAGADGWVRGDAEVGPDDACTWRLTALTGELCLALGRMAQRAEIEVDRQAFAVVGASAVEDAVGGARSSYADVFRAAPPSDRVTLAFETATAFKAGDAFVPFPLPDSVFGGYLATWQRFGNVDLGIGADAFREHCRERVAVESFELRSQTLVQDVPRPGRDDRPHLFSGFTGTVTYRIDRLGERGAKVLNALGDYARFCGTGSKKAQGAGQTRRRMG